MKYKCFGQLVEMSTGNISTLNGSSLKLVDKFTYLGSSLSSTERDIDSRLTKAWTGINSARGVMVIVVGIGHGDTSSNPGRDWLHFT